MYTSKHRDIKEDCFQLNAKEHIDASEGSIIRAISLLSYDESVLHDLGKIVSKQEDTCTLLKLAARMKKTLYLLLSSQYVA